MLPIGCSDTGVAATNAPVDVSEGVDSDVDASQGIDAEVAVSLIDNTLWEVVPEADDPFYPEDDSDVVPCTPSVYGSEVQGDDVWFSVKTVDCNYLTVWQPLLVDVPADAQLRVRLWHFKFTQTEGTYTHAIAVGDPPDTYWEAELPLPITESGLLPYDLVPISRSLSAGEPVYWHLNNHGLNSWHLIEFSANPGASASP